MPNWPRFFRAGLCAVYLSLCGGFAQPASALDGEDKNLSANLWLTRTWQTDEGLPDNNVTGVAQAVDGHLWVATSGGLMRFDGERFEKFTTSHLPKEPKRVVRTICLDKRGQLWLVLDRGTVIRVGETAARVFDDADGFPDARANAVAEDSAGDIWLAFGSEVCRIRGDTVEHFREQGGLPAGGNIWLAADGKGQLWFACGTQVGIYRDGRWQILASLDSGPVHLTAASSGGVWISTATRVLKLVEGGEPKPVVNLPERVTVQVMLEDHTGKLWIGTGADGLFRLNGNELERMPVSHPEMTALTEDREGNMWVGTAGGGLNLLRPRAIDLIGTQAGLPFESVRSVCQDAEGWMWAALQNGTLARGRGNEWNAISSAEGWPGGDVCCVVPAREGGVWIGTRDRGLQRWQTGKSADAVPPEGLGSQNIRSLFQATNGDLLIATDAPGRLWLFKDGKFQKLELPLKVRAIRALAEGVGGIIWAGTSDGQILRIQGCTVTIESAAQTRPPYSGAEHVYHGGWQSLDWLRRLGHGPMA